MENKLEEFFEVNNKVALAFSGGTDSAFLLYEAAKAGADVTAYYVRSQFQPQFEYEDAVKVIRWLEENLGAGEEEKEDCAAEGQNGAIKIKETEDCAADSVNGAIICNRKRYTSRTPVLKVLDLDILTVEGVQANSEARCYYCKRAIMQAIREQASLDGYSMIVDGNNASDVALERPGMRATAELGVRSPLRELGISKPVVRELSEQAGLPTASKPAYACLATRIKTGEPITAEKLATTEKAENILHEMGFTDFRVRMHETNNLNSSISMQKERREDDRIVCTKGVACSKLCAAIVQIRPDQDEILQKNKARIITELSELYSKIIFENR